jgi:hypothetical protein
MTLIKRLGFKQADEMDIHIALVAVRTSWFVIMIALLVWSIYDVITKLTISLPFEILSLGLIAYYSSDLIMRRRSTRGYQE